jgi:hypothetical protein
MQAFKREVTVALISILATSLVAVMGWLALQPIQKISQLETTVIELKVEVAKLQAEQSSLKVTLGEDHMAVMNSLDSLRQQLIDSAVLAARETKSASNARNKAKPAGIK